MLIPRKLIGELASVAYNASLLGQLPIVGDLVKDKLETYFHNYAYQIQKRADEIMPHESAKYQEFVVENAKICFEMIDAETILSEEHYDSWWLANEKSDAYLRKQKHLNDKEKTLLKQYLPTLIEAAIHELQEHSEFVNEAIRVPPEQIADLNGRMQIVEGRSSAPANPAILVEDISEELKNRWHDYPFLEQQRESRQKELSEFYKLPFGKFNNHSNADIDIHKLLQETIDSGNDHHERMLVILGAPGSGKTTVITYLLNKLRLDRPVRVYRLAEFINMNPANWPGELLARMGLAQEDLCDSVLILDGLDELDLQGHYQAFVEKLRLAWAQNTKITNFTLIITCRTTRLDPYTIRCSKVTLAPLSKMQILEFATDYLGKCPFALKGCLVEHEDLRDLLSIPFLLYLVLGLGITIDSDTTIANIYDTIFSLDGEFSIYKRCYNQHKHPVTAALAEKIHLFSQNVAVAMFSKEDVQDDLEQATYIPIAEAILRRDSTYKPEDLLIGQYFLLGRKERKIYFVHRSIFEYFVALSIFNALEELARSGKIAKELFQEMALGKCCALTPIAELLCLHSISEFPEIEQFLHHLIVMRSAQLKVFNDWAELIKLYYTFGLVDAVCDRPHGGIRALREAKNQAVNLFEICRTILVTFGEKNIDLLPMQYHNTKRNSLDDSSFENHFPVDDLRMKDMSNLNLSGCNFSHMQVSGAKFSYSDCSHSNWSRSDGDQTDFTGANLSSSDLRKASFVQAIFKGVDFTGANLAGADFSFSDLSGADFSDADVTGTNFTGAKVSHTKLERKNISNDQSKKNNPTDNSTCKNTFDYFDFANKDFSYSQWSGNNLFGADFSGARLYCANLADTNLSWAKIIRADISKADLSGANLHNAVLDGSDLTDANLQNAKLDGCRFTQCILPDGRSYEDAVEQNGVDVMRKFTDV